MKQPDEKVKGRGPLFFSVSVDQPIEEETMAEPAVDLDRLAVHLRTKMETEDLSVRTAAAAIGCGAATLSRLLQGSQNENVPDLAVVSKAITWLGKTLADFALPSKRRGSTIADVEVHLRALPGLDSRDVEALVAMVKAGYEHAKVLNVKKRS